MRLLLYFQAQESIGYVGFFISCEDPHDCHAATHIGIHTSIHAIQITVLTCIWLNKYRDYYIYTDVITTYTPMS